MRLRHIRYGCLRYTIPTPPLPFAHYQLRGRSPTRTATTPPRLLLPIPTGTYTLFPCPFFTLTTHLLTTKTTDTLHHRHTHCYLRLHTLHTPHTFRTTHTSLPTLHTTPSHTTFTFTPTTAHHLVLPFCTHAFLHV